MELTKRERSIIENTKTLKMISFVLAMFGIAGILLGLYAAIFRIMSPDARSLNFTLIGFSLGLLMAGWLLYQAYNLIKKFQTS